MKSWGRPAKKGQTQGRNPRNTAKIGPLEESSRGEDPKTGKTSKAKKRKRGRG